MKLQTNKRKTAYIVCFFLIMLGCFAGAVSADASEKQFKLSTDDIVRGLYNPDNEQLRSTDAEIVKLKEKSIYSRDGLSSLTLEEKLQKLALVHRDEKVSSYFSKLIEKGVVSGFGIDRFGYYFIWVKSSVDDTTISSIIEGFDKITQKTYGEIPLLVKVTNGATTTTKSVDITSRATNDDRWRPLIGGIQQLGVTSSTAFDSTVGFAATKNGQNGFVTHGHDFVIGSQVYQPTYSSDNLVGTVAAIGSVNSDSAWIPFGNVEASIYSPGSSGNKRAVSTYASVPDGSKVVVMAGAVTHSYGNLIGLADVEHDKFGRTLPDQWLASYSGTYGDSGAPVFQQDRTTHEFCLVGLHWGKNDDLNVRIFSSLGDVMTDLGIVPKTR